MSFVMQLESLWELLKLSIFMNEQIQCTRPTCAVHERLQANWKVQQRNGLHQTPAETIRSAS